MADPFDTLPDQSAPAGGGADPFDTLPDQGVATLSPAASGPPVPTHSPVESSTPIVDDEGFQALKRSGFVASQRDPSGYSKMLSDSKRTGVPVAVLENLEPFAPGSFKAIPDSELVDVFQKYPHLAESLKDPDFFSVSRDDLENLKAIETQAAKTGGGNIGDAFIRGLYSGLVAPLAQTPGLAVGLVGAPVNYFLRKTGLQTGDPRNFLGLDLVDTPAAQAYKGLAASVPQGEFNLEDYERDYIKRAVANLDPFALVDAISRTSDPIEGARLMAHRVAESAPSVIFSVVSAMMGHPEVGLGVLGATSGASAHAQALEKGIAPDIAAVQGGIYAVGEIAGEKLGVQAALQNVTRAAFKTYGKDGLGAVAKQFGELAFGAAKTEAKGEVFVTELSQAMSDYATGVDPDALKPENLFPRLAETAVVAAATGAGMVTPAGILQAIQENMREMAVNQQKEAFLKRGEAVKASQAAKTAPDEFSALQAETLKGGPQETTYLDTEAVQSYFQTQGSDPGQFFKDLSPEAAKSYEEGLRLGFIALPTSQMDLFAAGKDPQFHDAMADHMTYDPAVPTVTRAKEMAETAKKAQDEAAAQGESAAPETEQEVEQQKAFLNDVALQLERTGMKRKDAQTTSKILVGVRNLSRLSKVPFADLLKQMDLKIEGVEKIDLTGPGLKQVAEPSGEAPLDETVMANLRAMYKAYQAKGGQDTFERWHERLSRKPKKPGATPDKEVTPPPKKTPEQLAQEEADYQAYLAEEKVLEAEITLLLGEEHVRINKPVLEERAFNLAMEKEEIDFVRKNGRIGLRYKNERATERKISEPPAGAPPSGPENHEGSGVQGTIVPGPQRQSLASQPADVAALEQPDPAGTVETLKPLPKNLFQKTADWFKKFKLFQQVPAFASPFYSKLQKLIESKMGNTATADQIRGLIKDLSKDEIQWSGIEDFLKDNPKPSKKDLLDFLRANQLEVKEVTKQDISSKNELFEKSVVEAVEKKMKEEGWTDETAPEDLYDEIRANMAEDIDSGMDDEPGDTKFEKYTLPGGENYREVMFTLPQVTGDKVNTNETFRSSHFEEPNVLAHARVNERTDADGKKVLFIEEIQSDWHQEGRRKGYRREPDIKELRKKADANMDVLNSLEKEGKTDTKEFKKLNEETIRLEQDILEAKRNTSGVPDAPFKKTWHEFVLKRMIREAAEKGFDKIAWTTGEQQAARYDLSQQIDALDYKKNEDGTFSVSYQNNHRGNMMGEAIPGEKLEDYVGKEVAKRMLAGEGEKINFAANNQPRNEYNRLSGANLKVGGEGMKGFYDKIIPDFLNKFGKKYGAKVEESIISDGGTPNLSESVHSLPITPALKEAALTEGFSMFQPGQEGGQGAQGRFYIDPQGRFRIELSKLQDYSTAVHEFGHAYLELLKTLGEAKDATPEVAELWKIAQDEIGVKDGELSVENHEKFAKSFEAYLAQGKAPSKGLAKIFARLKNWMASLGKTLESLGVELSPKMTDLFDRILATQEEIDAARAAMGFAGILPKNIPKGAAQRLTTIRDQARLLAEESLLEVIAKEGDFSMTQFKTREKALEALHTEEMGSILALEGEIYRGLVKGVSGMREGAREALGKEKLVQITQLNRLRAKALVADATKRAVEALNRMPERQAGRWDVYITQEKHAAERKAVALSKGEWLKAAAYNDQMVYSHAMARQARKNQKDHARAFKHFDKFKGDDASISKTRDMDMVNAGRSVLASFGIGSAAFNAKDHLAKMKEYNPEGHADLTERIAAISENAMPWNNLIHADFLNLTEVVEGLWDQARESNKHEYGKLTVQTDQARELMGKELDTFQKAFALEPSKYVRMTDQEIELRDFIGAFAGIKRAEAWAAGIGKDMTSLGVDPVLASTLRFRIREKELGERVLAILKPLRGDKNWNKPILAPELTRKGKPTVEFATKMDLVGAIVHTGNGFDPGSNGYRLLAGNDILPNQHWADWDAEGNLDPSRFLRFVDRMVSEGTLTEADVDAVQKIWDLFNELKPELQAAKKKMDGYYFDEITAVPFKMFGKDYAGGYAPALMDKNASSKGFRVSEEQALSEGTFQMAPKTSFGSTKNRVRGFAAPLVLNLELVPLHVSEALKYIHIKPVVRQVAKLLLVGQVKEQLDTINPALVNGMLKPYLIRAASQVATEKATSKPGRFINKVARYGRQVAAMWSMFCNVLNTGLQFTGISNAARYKINGKPIGAIRLLRNTWKGMVRHPLETGKKMREMDPFMNDRVSTSFDVIERETRKILMNPTLVDNVRRWGPEHTYWLQVLAQSQVDKNVWSAAMDLCGELKLSPEDSVREAGRAVRMTQGSANPEDLSLFGSQQEWVKVLNMFAQYFETLFNQTTSARVQDLVARYQKTGSGKGVPWIFTPSGLAILFTVFMIPSFTQTTLQAVSGSDTDDDDDGEWLDDYMLALFLNGIRDLAAPIPVVRQLVGLGVGKLTPEKYDDRISASPVFSLLEKASNALPDLAQVVLEGKEFTGKAFEDLMALFQLLGLPVRPLARAGKYELDTAHDIGEYPLEHMRGVLTGVTSETPFEESAEDLLENGAQ